MARWIVVGVSRGIVPLVYGGANRPAVTLSRSAAGVASLGVVQDEYEPSGHVSTVTRHCAASSTSTSSALYGYDNVGRLRSECYPATGDACTGRSPRNLYTYDVVGNRASAAARTVVGTMATTVKTVYAYDAASQLLKESVGGAAKVSNTWTLNGALASSTTPAGTKTYTTDLTDELVSLTLPDGSTVGYTTDVSGNRTSRTVDGVLDVSWVWDELSALPVRIGETNATGTLTSSWLPDPASATGSPLVETTGGVSNWMLSDPFLNVASAVSMTGTVSGTKILDAFGEAWTTATGTLADSAFGFAGQSLDDATGLYDMRARDYNSSSGRSTAMDAVAVSTGTPYFAAYSYGYGNPLVFTDASGLNALSDFVSGFYGAAASVPVQWWNHSAYRAAVDWDGTYDTWSTSISNYRAGAKEKGSWTQANDTFNPVQQAVVAGKATVNSFNDGDYHAAGAHLFDTELGVANTCLLVYGGVKGVTALRTPAVETVTATAARTGASALDSLSPVVRANVADAIQRAASGKVRFPGHDGKVYSNFDGKLPPGGNYTEWTAAKAGAKRGADRVIVEGNSAHPSAIYYWDYVNAPVRVGP